MFKPDLDQARTYEQHDQDHVATSIRLQSKQFDQGLSLAQTTLFDFDLQKIKRIVYVGMGGSGMAGQIINSVIPYFSKIPFDIVNNYRLPVWADKNTLCILVSYSGNTEEVISCYHDALHRQCPTVAIATGGKLLQISIEKHLSFIRLTSESNPSNAPRYACMLMLGTTIGILAKTSDFSYPALQDIIPFIEKTISNLDTHVPTSHNPAKQLAVTFGGSSPIVITANHFSGVGDASLNLFHESLKTLALSFHLPDINHHLFEATTNPSNLTSLYQFLFIESSLYPQVITTRIEHSKQVLKKQGYRLAIIKPEGTNGLLESLESLVFLYWFSYYLSIINKRPILATPWVNYFKKIT